MHVKGFENTNEAPYTSLLNLYNKVDTDALEFRGIVLGNVYAGILGSLSVINA